jgi:hypothetical protein
MLQLLKWELVLLLISKTNNHLSFQTLIQWPIKNKMRWLIYHKYSNLQEETDMTLMKSSTIIKIQIIKKLRVQWATLGPEESVTVQPFNETCINTE